MKIYSFNIPRFFSVNLMTIYLLPYVYSTLGFSQPN
ncbi:MAG: hypothetical protein FOGNACKC_02807 [Anaerolineae bacterium]|nr:hypothetical protein [Anaerolineae bacterium]